VFCVGFLLHLGLLSLLVFFFHERSKKESMAFETYKINDLCPGKIARKKCFSRFSGLVKMPKYAKLWRQLFSHLKGYETQC
jgi:hypothetical protein